MLKRLPNTVKLDPSNTNIYQISITLLGLLWLVFLVAILLALLPPFIHYLEGLPQTWVVTSMPYMYIITIFVIMFMVTYKLLGSIRVRGTSRKVLRKTYKSKGLSHHETLLWQN